MNRKVTVSFLITGLLACAVADASPSQPQAATAPKPASQAQPATAAQSPSQAPPAAAPKPIPPFVPATPVVPPAGYVIGPDDVLQVQFWREKDMSSEVTVRPDGMISLPLLNEVQAAGLTPEQLRDKVNELAKKFLQEDPTVTVIIKAINSRKVFITGSVGKPGTYPLTTPTTVLQLIAMAGGLAEFADKSNIAIMRPENGKLVRYMFNYKDVAKGKNLSQNIELKPGDTVIVP